jgi:hypothetical protein
LIQGKFGAFGVCVVVALGLALPAKSGAVVEQFPFLDGNGAPFTFTVPNDVSHIQIDAVGAAGGGPSGGMGALGGEVLGSFVFTAGQALQFDVGGNGGGCATPDAPNGGTNGGGSGGSGCAGGGGGATDVRTGACAATGSCGPSNAVIVAGGGGGNATDNDEGQGGTGGGPNGANGTAGHNGAGISGGGGQGGTQTAGGAGGVGGVGSFFPNPSPSGGDGTSFQGGVGGHDGCSGGGGGGGFFGGGGGGSANGGNGCGGGGGGSSFVGTSGTNISFNSNVAGTLGGGVITITFLYDTITTSKPSASPVAANTPVTDTVTVSGNGTDVPTGQVSFKICGPLATPAGCTSAAGTAVGSPVSLKSNNDTNNTASAKSSTSVSESTPGYYCFFASYPGDTNYNPSTGTGSSGCFIVQGPSLTSATATPGTLQLGATASDNATVTGSGVPAPTGSVVFSVCGPLSSPTACTSGGTSDGTATLVSVSGSQVATAPQFTPTALGVWCFRANYNGDAVYLSSSDSNAVNNCFSVTPANSTTTSTPASPSIQLGATTHDSIKVSGNPVAGTPSGSVNVSVCGPLTSASGCSTGGTSLGTATLSGGSATGANFTPTALGTYCYRAAYPAAGNYLASTDASDGGCFTVTQASSTATSTPGNGSIQLGASTTDSVTVTGNATAGTPTGVATFSVCGPLPATADCAPGGTALGTMTLSGGTATSPSFVPSALGTYCFRVDYGGNVNYLASSDGSAGECFTVTPANSTTTSTPASTSIQLGASTDDSVVVSGNQVGGTPIGSASFSVCGPLGSASGCATGGTSIGTATLSGGSATSPSFTPGALGTYCYRAVYTATGNYLGSSDASAGECFTVTSANSTTTSTPASASIQLAASTTDSVTVSGNATGGTPNGNVTFSVCGPLSSASGCATGGASLGGPVALSGGSATSPAFSPPALGTYCFRADYGGAGNYLASSDGSVGECFTVSPANSTTTSTPASASIQLGDSTSDSVTVTGNAIGGTPTGTVKFSLCGSPGPLSGCATGGTSVGTATLSGGSATGPSGKPGTLGKFCYRADYVGEGNYLGSTDGSVGECFTVTKANSKTTSTPAATSVGLGDPTHDSVLVSGNTLAGPPTGLVTVSVCGPLSSASGCANGGTSLGSAFVNGDSVGSPDFVPTAFGTYCYRADFGGSPNYLASSDGSAAACFTVIPASSSASSKPAEATIDLGQSDTDSVTLTGNDTAGAVTGTVNFSVCGPLASASGCATGGKPDGSADVGQDGSATSPAFTPSQAGTYCFRADYGGDTNYGPASETSFRGCFTVTKADAMVTSTADKASTTLAAGDTGHVVVTGLNGGPTPSGEVTFSACGPLPGPTGCGAGTGVKVGPGPVTIAGGSGAAAKATSAQFRPTRAGIWCLRADYSGDSNYKPSGDGSPAGCFTVAAALPPSVQVASPVDGRSYSFGAAVRAVYTCQESTGGPGLAACAGTSANSSLLATHTAGTHVLTVTARSMDGLTTTHTVTYTVLPDNHFTISAHKGKVRGKIRGDANGKITFYVKVPGPGTIDALVSAADREIAKTASVPAPAAHHFAYGRAHAHARRPATVKLVLKPNRMGRKLVRHHRGRIVLRLTVGFTPDHGIQRLSGVFGIHLAP